MKLTPYAQQLQHFEQHRELCDVPREPLSAEDVLIVESYADFYIRRTRSDDNDSRDYDPLWNRVFKWSAGTTTAATYDFEKTERHLERTDVTYRERNVIRVHRTPDALQVWDSFSDRDSWHRLECWHVDYRNPEQSFYQDTTLPPDSWVAP